MDFEAVTNSSDETIELGQKIGSQLKGGSVIAVCGLLGSGKTHLIKGIATGAGAGDSKDVNSPTFVIVNEYTGSVPKRDKGHLGPPMQLDIFHIDAYRLDSVDEFEKIGFDDFCYPESVVLIEWADKIEPALEGVDYIRIELSHAGQKQRSILIENAPEYLKL